MRRLILAAILLLGSAAAGIAQCREDIVDLRGDWGQVAFQIEIADTDQTRARGLMFVREMARDAGMLFVYDKPQPATFWMKNTYIPLDMLFMDRAGTVTHVHSNAIPHDTSLINGGDDVFAVLEINAGLAKRYGISEGTQLRHPVFEGGPANWSCKDDG